jgi:hypothetical protein
LAKRSPREVSAYVEVLEALAEVARDDEPVAGEGRQLLEGFAVAGVTQVQVADRQ